MPDPRRCERRNAPRCSPSESGVFSGSVSADASERAAVTGYAAERRPPFAISGLASSNVSMTSPNGAKASGVNGLTLTLKLFPHGSNPPENKFSSERIRLGPTQPTVGAPFRLSRLSRCIGDLSGIYRGGASYPAEMRKSC